jgi:hypothetical protein
MNNRHGKNERDGQMALQSQCPVRWPASARSWPLWRTANRPVDPTCAPIVRFLFKFNWNKIKFHFIKNTVAKRRTHVTTTSRTRLADELPHEKCHKSHRGTWGRKYPHFQLTYRTRTKNSICVSTTNAPHVRISFIHRRPIGTPTSAAVPTSAGAGTQTPPFGKKWRNKCTLTFVESWLMVWVRLSRAT